MSDQNLSSCYRSSTHYYLMPIKITTLKTYHMEKAFIYTSKWGWTHGRGG